MTATRGSFSHATLTVKASRVAPPPNLQIRKMLLLSKPQPKALSSEREQHKLKSTCSTTSRYMGRGNQAQIVRATTTIIIIKNIIKVKVAVTTFDF